jgi:pyrimidine operon attenuation protein/uracil phosphoribosyltransferase
MVEDIRQLRLDDPLIIGIHTGGAWIAERLHHSLGCESALGSLDISFYRDDFSRVGLNPKVKSSDLPESVEDREILLVDDVLHTGRTIRAALNEIFSFGRPAAVKLVVALERPGRELPIKADICGVSLALDPMEQAKISQQDNNLVFYIVQHSTTSGTSN